MIETSRQHFHSTHTSSSSAHTHKPSEAAAEVAGDRRGGYREVLQSVSVAKATDTHKMPRAKGKKRGAMAAPAARPLSTVDETDENQYYGRVVRQLGHGIVMVRYYGAGNSKDLEVKMREIRAKVPIRRRQNKLKVSVDGLVIISIRSFGADTTGDVIHTYRDGEEATLRRMRELPIELIGASGDSDAEDDPFAIEFGEANEFSDGEVSDGEE